MTYTRKEPDSDIFALCGEGGIWSPRVKVDAIKDIDLKIYSYYVLREGKTADVYVARASSGKKYLRTDWDGTTHNSLDDLPDC